MDGLRGTPRELANFRRDRHALELRAHVNRCQSSAAIGWLGCSIAWRPFGRRERRPCAEPGARRAEDEVARHARKSPVITSAATTTAATPTAVNRRSASSVWPWAPTTCRSPAPA